MKLFNMIKTLVVLAMGLAILSAAAVLLVPVGMKFWRDGGAGWRWEVPGLVSASPDYTTGRSAIRSHVAASYAGGRVMAMSALVTVGKWDYRLVRIEGRNAFGGYVIKEMVAELSGSTLISLMEKDLAFKIQEEDLAKLSGQGQVSQRKQLDQLRHAELYALE